VLQFGSAGVFEAEYLAALWINAGHYVLDDAIFPGRIHRLEDQQHGMAVRCVKDLLQRTQFGNMLFQYVLIMLLRLKHGLHVGGPFSEIDPVSFAYAKVPCSHFHLNPSDDDGCSPGVVVPVCTGLAPMRSESASFGGLPVKVVPDQRPLTG
jgi:hypothetical protein